MNLSIVKKNFIAFVVLCVALVGMALSAVNLAHATTLRVVQTPTVHLYTGENSTATTVRITPYPKDLDGTKLTITDFGTNPTFTVDPKITNYEEIESFTSITDNGDNTATLTGVSRDLTSKYPYTTAGTGKTHGAGATVVFGNNPQVYGRLAAPENPQSWTDVQTYASTTAPRYDVSPSNAQWAVAPGTQLVNLDKLNATAIAGASNSSETTNGIVELATGVEAASSTFIGGTGGRLVLAASLATSSPWAQATTTIVATGRDGRINPLFMSTSTTVTYTFGNMVSNSGVFASASSTFMGTTTIAASNASTTALVLNGLPYQMPAVRGASSTVLTENGYGHLTYEVPDWRLLAATTTTGVLASTTVPSIAAATDLRVVVDIPNQSSGFQVANIQFNSDSTGVYQWSETTQTGTATTDSGVSSLRFANNNAQQITAQFNITNVAARPKTVTGLVTGVNGSSAGTNYTFWGVWNNSSAQITSVTVGCGLASCPVGTQIRVYGSNQ